jgi:response regulator of citrate/malate metabolism
MSVKSDKKNIQKALRKGAEDYLFKPFNIQDLINKIIQNFKLTNQRR